MNEEALIAAAQKGDVDAFNELVLEYQNLAYSVAYRVLGNTDRAADATQDAFLRAYRALHQFRGGSFKSWLLRIVTNCSYDVLRYRQRRPATGFEDLVEDEERTTLMQADHEDPEDYVARREFDDVIQDALATLPEEQRVAVIMADIEEMSYEEIAEVTDTRLGTVKSRIYRGRAKMRDFFAEHPELLPPGFRLAND